MEGQKQNPKTTIKEKREKRNELVLIDAERRIIDKSSKSPIQKRKLKINSKCFHSLKSLSKNPNTRGKRKGNGGMKSAPEKKKSRELNPAAQPTWHGRATLLADLACWIVGARTCALTPVRAFAFLHASPCS